MKTRTRVRLNLIMVLLLTFASLFLSTKATSNNDVNNSREVCLQVGRAINILPIVNNDLLNDVQLEVEEENIETSIEEDEIIEYINEEIATTVFSTNTVSVYDINVYTDLAVMREITTEEMNMIIDHWASLAGGSPFEDHGQAFIDAAKATGLDPVYILAHAGVESAWGNSGIARDKHNYFGIGAFDSSPYESSYEMGDSVYVGIVEGAKWIDRNYYEGGQTSLYTMRYNNGTHEYCTSETWMYTINDIIRSSYELVTRL